MRVAVMGGTFNPIHYGHLRVAEEVRESLGLDRVVFIPSFIPPHKEDGVAAPQDRLEMTRLAAKGNPAFIVSEIEIKRGGRSFTIDTVEELKKAGDEVSVSLIIGNDSFNEITSWHRYEEIFEKASLIIVPRPGFERKAPAEVLPVELARKFWYDSHARTYHNYYGNSVVFLDTTLIGISSSDIRERSARGASIKYLLPEEVERYIKKRGLYGPLEKET